VPQVDPELYALQPWYHDFGSLGLDTTFLSVPLTFRERIRRASDFIAARARRRPSSAVPRARTVHAAEIVRRAPSPHVINQSVKDPVLIDLLTRALSAIGPRPACLDLFSADGYYSCRIKALAPESVVTGVELDAIQIRRAELAARKLGFADVRFVRDDVVAFLAQSSSTFDLVQCAGGLYHTSDPIQILRGVDRVARSHVVVQSVVTLESEDAGYFVQPPRGWQHGCRFTHAWLQARIEEIGWHVLGEARAELPGNPDPQDRGSSFFLCRRP
jgi:precorrin-6B methylase 2